MNRVFGFTVLLVVVMLFMIAAKVFREFPDVAVEQQARTYCRLVHDGAWPDYDHIYARQCKADGSVNWDYVNQR